MIIGVAGQARPRTWDTPGVSVTEAAAQFHQSVLMGVDARDMRGRPLTLQRRRGDGGHVLAGAALWRRLGPVDFTAQVGGSSCGLGQRYGDALLILGSAARHLPHGAAVAFVFVGARALVYSVRGTHDIRVGRDVEADRYAFRDQ